MKKLIAIICILFLTSCANGYLVETRYGVEYALYPRSYSYTVISVAPPVHRGHIPIRLGRTTIYYKSIQNGK